MDLARKEKEAIQLIKDFEPREGYWLAYSGGKDSDVIATLAELADVKYKKMYNVVSVDAPETIKHCKEVGAIFNYPRYSDGKVITMRNLIPKKRMPPTRIIRYCCAELKETGGKGLLKMTGVRKSESRKRNELVHELRVYSRSKKLRSYINEQGILFEDTGGGIKLDYDNEALRYDNDIMHKCYQNHNTTLNPIASWTEDDVWTFLKHYNVKTNPLYECGFKRVGCIGCPMAGRKQRYAEFRRYPKFKEYYIRAFQAMADKNALDGIKNGKTSIYRTGEEWFKWWLEEDPNQLSFFEDLEEL